MHGASAYLSTIKDAGAVGGWGSLSWHADVPAGTGLTLETRSSADGLTWSDWSAVAISGGPIGSPAGRYLQYRATLTSSDTDSPRLDDVAYGSVDSPSLAATPPGALTAIPTDTVSPTAFALGSASGLPGFVDAIPHQLVRAADDRLYAFAGAGQYQTYVKAYWTSSTGLPASGAAFDGEASLSAGNPVLTLDAAYDGATTVHVLVYTSDGSLTDYPFDTATRAFRAGRQIVHRAFSYDAVTNTLTLVADPTQLDPDGAASHPALAVSPLDGSLTVAWVSEATNPASIRLRTRSAAGVWGGLDSVGAEVRIWTSPNFGVNVDQGPSLLIGPDGTRHLAYIEGYDATGAYGRVHYESQPAGGIGWTSATLSQIYSHHPTLAITGAGRLYLLGHGHSRAPSCLDMRLLCAAARNPDGSWGPLQPLATPPGSDSFDTSVSVKWSVVGFNRPQIVEFLFYDSVNGSDTNTALYYGRVN